MPGWRIQAFFHFYIYKLKFLYIIYMNIYTITGPDINNGTGFRITIWVAGCSHNCKGCHNAWLQNYKLGKDIGLEENFNNIYNKIKEKVNHDYIEGITLSGGDPLAQSATSLYQLDKLLTKFKEDFPSKTVWLYTGYTYEELLNIPDEEKLDIYKSIFKKLDIMVDGKFVEELKDLSLPFRGSSNQRILDMNARKRFLD